MTDHQKAPAMLEAIASGLGQYQVGIAHLSTQLDEISRALVEVRDTVRKVPTELQRTRTRLNDELRVMRRPANYVDLSSEAQLEIDRQLGIDPEPKQSNALSVADAAYHRQPCFQPSRTEDAAICVMKATAEKRLV